MDPCEVLPDVVFIRIFAKLSINELHRVRKVRFGANGKKMRKSAPKNSQKLFGI